LNSHARERSCESNLRHALRTVCLQSQIHGRENNIGLLRLAAALAVLLFHCYALYKLWKLDPIARFLPGVDLGALGVGIFFFLSGLLVTQSCEHRNSLREFLLARALRIYPALVVAAAVAIAFATASTNIPATDFLASPEVRDFFLRTSTGLSVLGRLPSVYAHNPIPYALNGSLWTLPVELRMYWAVAAFGVLGLLVRKWAFLAIVCLLTALFAALPESFPITPDGPGVRRVIMLFALGAAASICKDRVMLSIPVAISLVLVAIALPPIRESLLAYCFVLGYGMLVLAYHPALRFPDFLRNHDYSYGLYIYAFPIQQTLIERGGAHLHEKPMWLFLFAFPISLAFAIASWHFVERPALRLKTRLFAPAHV